jgi:hypothetical protein
MENIAGVIGDLTHNLIPRSENARDIQTARTQIDKLTQALRQLGDGVKDLEDRFHRIDATVDLFTKLKRQQLWWALAIAFMAGTLSLPVLTSIIDCLRSLMHI